MRASQSLCRCSFKHNIKHVTLWLTFSAPPPPPAYTQTRAHFLVCVLRNKEFSSLSLEQSHKLSPFHKYETAKGFAIKLNILTVLRSFSQNKMQIYLMKCFTYTYNDAHLSPIWLGMTTQSILMIHSIMHHFLWSLCCEIMC